MVTMGDINGTIRKWSRPPAYSIDTRLQLLLLCYLVYYRMKKRQL